MPEVYNTLRARLTELETTLFKLSDYLHQNVEKSGEEYLSVERLCTTLEQFGFSVTREIANLPTSFHAEAGPSDAPVTIGFLCEYDGLPPYGQSCGHNVSSACSVGAAALLAPLATHFGLRIVVAGTPAEEGFGGKYVMADNGVFDDIDVALLLYPGMRDIAASRTLFAKSIEVTFLGAAAHGAAHPELGKNALDAFVSSYSAIAGLRQHVHPQAKIHGIVRDGGIHPQVVPDLVRAIFVLRAPTASILNDLEQRVLDCFRGAALQTDTQFEVKNAPRVAEALLPNTALAQAYEAALQMIGRTPTPTDELMGAWSTDAGYLSRKLPVLQPQLAMTPSNVSPHSYEFHMASTGPQAYEAIRAGSLTLALTAISVASQPDLLRRMREEFVSRLQEEDTAST